MRKPELLEIAWVAANCAAQIEADIQHGLAQIQRMSRAWESEEGLRAFDDAYRFIHPFHSSKPDR